MLRPVHRFIVSVVAVSCVGQGTVGLKHCPTGRPVRAHRIKSIHRTMECNTHIGIAMPNAVSIGRRAMYQALLHCPVRA